MKIFKGVFASLLLVATAVAQTPPADPMPEDLAGLRSALLKILEETKVPGMSIALVSRDEVLLAEGLGLADVEQKTPATADTLFRIGSTTKALTAFAALKLRAEGKLDFDATLASLAPEVEFHNAWEAENPVRIVHLLEHTAGFDDTHFRDYANYDDTPSRLRESLAHDPDSRTSRWPPGERFSYCNSGPPVVAYVIQKITGQPFHEYVQQKLFDPIGMATANYFQDPKTAALRTTLYHADGRTPHPYMRISMWPSGSINASARDMAAYVRFHLNRGQVNGVPLISEADLTRMETPGTTPAARAGMPMGYGFYNATSFDEQGRLYHGHGGGVPGGLTSMAYSHETGFGYATMINASSGAAAQRIDKLIRGYLGKNMPKGVLPAAVAISDEQAARYAGYYVPTNPRVQMHALMGRLTGISRLSFENGAARFGPVFGGPSKTFVGATANLLRREDQPLASLALLEPGADGVTIAAGGGSLRQVPAPVAFAPLALIAFAALMALSALLFVPVWGVRALLGKISLAPHLGLRLWPVAAALALIALPMLFMAMMADPLSIDHYSVLGLRSGLLSAASLAVVLVPLAGFALLLRPSQRAAYRGLWWHAALVLGAAALLGLYLLATGAIPMVTWT